MGANKEWTRLTYLCRWRCTPQGLFAQCRLSCGLKCHSFSRTGSPHKLRILGNRRLESFRSKWKN